MTVSKKLSIPNIDPRNEVDLVTEAQINAFNKSSGKLSDFTAGSPLLTLIETQAFVGGELLYYLNKILPTISLQIYSNFGVEKMLGTNSNATVTFELIEPLNQAYEIPAEFVLKAGSLEFITNESLTIPAGIITGEVNVISNGVGNEYNVLANTITTLTQPLTFIKSVTNIEPASGATDPETIQDVITRGNQEIRGDGLVSAIDYEKAAENIIGTGSKFKCLGNLAQDKVSFKLGSAHLFGINNDGTPINNSQISQVLVELTNKIHVGSVLFVNPVELVEIDLDITVETDSTLTAISLLNNIKNHIIDYLSPANNVGQNLFINELEYEVRSVLGTKRVKKLDINLIQNQDLLIPNEYSSFNINSITIRVEKDGVLLIED